MDTQDSDVNLAELMAGIEEMISRHYKAHAEKFTQYRDFWEKIAAEEVDHAASIRDLYAKAGRGLLTFNESRFNKRSVQEVYAQMEIMLPRFLQQAASMKAALQSSLSVESLLLERKFFEVFETDDADIKAVLARLARETGEHRERIEQLLKQV